jgi:hypothetical protein
MGLLNWGFALLNGLAAEWADPIAKKEMVCPAAVMCALTCGDIAAETTGQ